MKKLTKKLFISVMTLVLTAMALGTSTFAWFSMNTTVNASSMQVTAKSNATYLLIGTGDYDTAEEIQTRAIASISDALTVTAGQIRAKTSEDLKRYPCSFNNSDNSAAITDANAQGGSTSVNAHRWWTASNKNMDSATNARVNVQMLTFVDDLGQGASSEDQAAATKTEQDFVVIYKLYLTLSADSEAYSSSNYIRVGIPTVASEASVSALVKFGTGANAEYVNLNSTTNHDYVTGFELNGTSVLEVTVYMYIDGESTNVNTQYYNANTNALSGTIGLKFDLTYERSAD